MATEQIDFHDPALKNAVKRVWGQEHAPTALRGNISAALAAESAAGGPDVAGRITPRWAAAAAKSARSTSPFMKFAAAAGLVVGVGALAYSRWQYIQPTPAPIHTSVAYNSGVTFKPLAKAMS